jgi:hypothetical protein
MRVWRRTLWTVLLLGSFVGASSCAIALAIDTNSTSVKNASVLTIRLPIRCHDRTILSGGNCPR